MNEIKELKLKKDVREYIEKQKEQFKKMFKTDDVKLVGITFHFLIEGEMLSSVGLYAKGFNPDDFGQEG